jgi:hypothetical protein
MYDTSIDGRRARKRMDFNTWHTPSRPEQQTQQPYMVPVVFGPARQAQFAYRVVTVDDGPESRLDEPRLNALGKQGWLLVSVLPRSVAARGRSLDYLFVRMEP